MKYIVHWCLVHSWWFATITTDWFQNFYYFRRKVIPTEYWTPQSPLPPALATTTLLSVCIYLPILDILHKWNHTVCVAFCVWLFALSIVFVVHPCCSIYQYFLTFYEHEMNNFVFSTILSWWLQLCNRA